MAEQKDVFGLPPLLAELYLKAYIAVELALLIYVMVIILVTLVGYQYTIFISMKLASVMAQALTLIASLSVYAYILEKCLMIGH